MNPDDIRPQHWQRLAYVYIRQSSLHQVLHHRESRRRQQAFQQRALQLGWPADRIRVVEEDLGQSGARHQRRSGFEDLVAQVALAAVGLILALEVSRLARGNRDGYHLLDICSITGTLIADAEGLYDPREYNDRLLLGLKGTLGEAELHLMKQRLVEAMRAKAARGEFRFRLPPGYFWGEAGRMQKEVDAQVRSALESIFRRFERLGTIHQVHTALVEEGQQVPVRRGRGRQIGWTLPSYGSLARVLKNPLYAGAYVWGRRQVEESLDEAQRPVKRVRERPREDWPVLIPDHHPGYISWEEFEKNQAQIRANYRGPAQVGAPREGRSLLQGLILCGLCGRRMGVAYSYGSGTFRDRCVERREQRGVPVCQSFGAVRLEEAVEALLLEALQPLALEAMIEAAATVERTSEAQREQLQQRRQRARYEVDLARRQYEAVDPDHRLVAQELERRWEQALEDLQRVEEQTEEQLRALERPLEPQSGQSVARAHNASPRQETVTALSDRTGRGPGGGGRAAGAGALGGRGSDPGGRAHAQKGGTPLGDGSRTGGVDSDAGTGILRRADCLDPEHEAAADVQGVALYRHPRQPVSLPSWAPGHQAGPVGGRSCLQPGASGSASGGEPRHCDPLDSSGVTAGQSAAAGSPVESRGHRSRSATPESH